MTEAFSLDVEHLPDAQVVKLTTHGTLSLDALKQLIAAALAAEARYATGRFLIDHRGVKVALSIIELYELPRLFEQLGVRRSLRAALLFRPDSEDARSFYFHEDRSVNTGFQQRVFNDEPAAMAWLEHP